MREYKFRGKTLDGNEWCYGYLVVKPDKQTLIEQCDELRRVSPQYVVDPETVGEYTGLFDCKGREIYEGDVVEFNDSWHDINGNYCEKMQRGYIKYDYGEFSIVTLCGEAFLRLLSTCVQSDTLIVIGNVYDNPELLEVEA